jgi:hypothetical protein
MKKLNLICASIAVLCGTAANAGTLAGTTVFATENFGATSTATMSVKPQPLTYSMTTIQQVNAGATVYFVLRLNGGTFAAAPLAADFSFAGGNGGVNVGAPILSTDMTTVAVPCTSPLNGNGTTIGLGAFSYTPAAGDIVGVNTTLNAASGALTATVSLIGNALVPTAASLNSTNALPQTLDAPLPTTNFATAAQAITGAVAALPTTNSVMATGVKIDLTATPPGSAYTAGDSGSAIIGAVSFKNVTGTQANLAGTVDYTLASGSTAQPNTGVSVVVTPGANQAFPIGSVLTLDSGLTCQNPVGVASAAITAASSTKPVTLTWTGPVLTLSSTNVPSGGLAICMTAPSAGNVATPLTPTVAATLAPAVGTDAADTANGTGYALQYNGSQVTIKTYWPNALSAYGYGSYIRIVNTGSVAATVSGAFINQANGVVGSSYPLVTNLAAGAATVVTGPVIESILGAPASTDRPRLQLTAPTNGMQVQYFLQSPDGTITELSSNLTSAGGNPA